MIYASFWQAPLSPLAVLLHALETSLRQGGFMDGVRSSATALRTSLDKQVERLHGNPYFFRVLIVDSTVV